MAKKQNLKNKLVVKPKVVLKPVPKAAPAPAPAVPALEITGPVPPKGESDFAPKLDTQTLKKQAEESANFQAKTLVEEASKEKGTAQVIAVLAGAKSEGTYTKLMSQEDKVAEAERQAAAQAEEIYESEQKKASAAGGVSLAAKKVPS